MLFSCFYITFLLSVPVHLSIELHFFGVDFVVVLVRVLRLTRCKMTLFC
jgi:hypothetical protein